MTNGKLGKIGTLGCAVPKRDHFLGSIRPPGYSIWHFGNAFASSIAPPAVTFVMRALSLGQLRLVPHLLQSRIGYLSVVNPEGCEILAVFENG